MGSEEQRMKDETPFRFFKFVVVPCANGCGSFGVPETANLCSRCYRDSGIQNHQQDCDPLCVNKLAFPKIPAPACVMAVDGVPAKSNRCSNCHKKVGFVGFTCRCGATFCGTHRYPEQHNCGFDYKSAGRESIAKSNPVVKADKLDWRI